MVQQRRARKWMVWLMVRALGVLGVIGAHASAVADEPAAPPAPTIAIGLAEPPPKLINSIRLTAYNILNLFDDIDDPDLSGDRDDMHNRWRGLRAKPHEQCLAVAETIRRLDSDILALQEIESEAALTWFRDTYLKDMGYEHMVSIDSGDARGIEQAVLSRYPLLDAKVWPKMELGGVHPDNYGNSENWYAGEPLLFRRSPLRVTVRIPATEPNTRDVDITLFVVHHKSGGPAGYWREAEARGVTRLIREFSRENPERPIIVLGDFNAQPYDESMSIYRRARLRDVHLQRPNPIPAEQMTHASRRVIDYILVNEAMMTYIVRRGPFVLGTPVKERGADRDAPNPEGFASDHMPVSIDLHTRNQGDLAPPEGYRR